MEQPPFNNPNSNPLPDANDVERQFNKYQERLPQVHNAEMTPENQTHLQSETRKLRNLFIGLLVGGLLVGGLLSVGLVWTLNRLDMVNPPGLDERR
jgi:hypothetical protein